MRLLQTAIFQNNGQSRSGQILRNEKSPQTEAMNRKYEQTNYQ